VLDPKADFWYLLVRSSTASQDDRDIRLSFLWRSMQACYRSYSFATRVKSRGVKEKATRQAVRGKVLAEFAADIDDKEG
jgi:hypothetical protein